jgi:hypothetical protein
MICAASMITWAGSRGEAIVDWIGAVLGVDGGGRADVDPARRDRGVARDGRGSLTTAAMRVAAQTS